MRVLGPFQKSLTELLFLNESRVLPTRQSRFSLHLQLRLGPFFLPLLTDDRIRQINFPWL